MSGACRAVAKTASSLSPPHWQDVAVPLPGLRLHDGGLLDDAVLRLRLFGCEATAEDKPVVAVLGGISADRRVTDIGDGRLGWWSRQVGPGRAIDTRRFRVLGIDLLPGTEEGRIRTLTPADQARALVQGLDHLGIARLHGLVGASYGGMVGLSFAAAHGHRLERLAVISAAHRPSAWATAQRGIQRRLLQLGLETGRVDEAVSLARQLAMTGYRTAEELQARFGEEATPHAAGQPYAVCDYLTARGRAYVPLMPPERWISLSDALDRHRVTPEDIRVPVHVLGFTADLLVPPADLQDLAARLPVLAGLRLEASPYGHDGFLKEDTVVATFLDQALLDRAPLPLPCCRSELAA